MNKIPVIICYGQIDACNYYQFKVVVCAPLTFNQIWVRELRIVEGNSEDNFSSFRDAVKKWPALARGVLHVWLQGDKISFAQFDASQFIGHVVTKKKWLFFKRKQLLDFIPVIPSIIAMPGQCFEFELRYPANVSLPNKLVVLCYGEINP